MNVLEQLVGRLTYWVLKDDEDFQRIIKIIKHENFATNTTDEEKKELENHLKEIFREHGLNPGDVSIKQRTIRK